MSTVPSSHQNPDEFHGLHAQEPTNIDRGQDAARQAPEAGQVPAAGAPHQSAPNYGDFGHPEAAAPTPEGFEPRYGQEEQPAPDQTHHGDDRFRQSGTRNWDTNEPANPHHGSES
jgi:hypothetical protein